MNKMKTIALKIRRQFKMIKLIISKIKKGSDLFPSHRDVSEYDGITAAIVRKMINHSDSVFTIAPISGKKYIINKTFDIFVIMEDSKVEITNHVYHYVVFLDKKIIEKLNDLYNRKVDSQRLEYERQIISQINNTLHDIFNKVNQ
jgi:hypothetical protein